MKCRSSHSRKEPASRQRWTTRGVLLLALQAMAGCTPKTNAPPDGPNGGKDAVPAVVGTLTWARGDWPAELQADSDWQSAARGETWALLRLGERREQLRARIEAGGPAAEFALRAWPYAKSAWVERGVLCRSLPAYVAADWAPLLAALRESMTQAEQFGEVLDPDAAFACERTFELLDHQVAVMTDPVFDEYAATCQAFGRNPQPRAL